jgi:hypothetical protein
VGDSFERDVARAVNPTLVEYRLGQLENKVREMEQRMDSLATRKDVEGINAKLDQAASAVVRAAAQRSEHSFSWRTAILGGAAAGLIASILITISTAIASRVHF